MGEAIEYIVYMHTFSNLFLVVQKSELQHLIKSQPSAKEAVRLQSFVRPNPMYSSVKDHLSKAEVCYIHVQYSINYSYRFQLFYRGTDAKLCLKTI